MFSFATPWLLCLLVLPLLLPLFFSQQQAKISMRFPRFAARLPQASYHSQSSWRILNASSSLFFMLWVCLVIAAAQPRWLGEPLPLQQNAREILIALDLSGSMRQEDMQINGRPVTRLYAAHHILADFIRRRQGDKIGLIVYADSAHLYVPITSDLATVAQLAEQAQIGLVGEQTALGDAIGLSIQYFLKQQSKQRLIIILTDGMINAGKIDANQAILLAKNNDVRIHTIGVGADEISLPGLFGERRVPNQELNEPFLAEVAAVTGGEYFRARNVQEMERIYALIDALEPIQSDELFFRPQQSLVHWPLGIAFALVIFASLVSAVKQRHTMKARSEP